MVVTGRAHRAAVEEQLPELADANVVLESEPKDSTAAIGLAAAILRRREPDVIIGSFAADHVITDEPAFRAAVEQAVAAADAGLHRDDRHHADRAGDRLRLHPLRRGARDRRRRPTRSWSRASSRSPTWRPRSGYLADGGYLWNAGMFIARADVLLERDRRSPTPSCWRGLEELAEAWDDPATARPGRRPDLAGAAQDRDRLHGRRAGGRRGAPRRHPRATSTGTTWATSRRSRSCTSGGRASDLAILGENARVLADASSGIVVSQSDRIISLIGVRDIVVVDTPDALLVTTSENAQRVKSVVDALKLSGRDDVL